ncbi:unnamed protein product [Caenorhabditis auriculariae]|uniref:Uncharacterized protein n=1 Tax=Caenorhabditis auriculariae TaxID=2777116 RepID=A0A8S1HHU8_9PELO|nr:unnamed protein product [Caenorhabditis auriculariae]
MRINPYWKRTSQEKQLSSFRPYSNPTLPVMDLYVQEMLMSSPDHLFSMGVVPPQMVSTSWEQWLCFLASNLTAQQWQVVIFEADGLLACPLCIVRRADRSRPPSFLLQSRRSGRMREAAQICETETEGKKFGGANSTVKKEPRDDAASTHSPGTCGSATHRRRMGNAASGGTSRREVHVAAQATVFTNGRVAAAETKEEGFLVVVATPKDHSKILGAQLQTRHQSDVSSSEKNASRLGISRAEVVHLAARVIKSEAEARPRGSARKKRAPWATWGESGRRKSMCHSAGSFSAAEARHSLGQRKLVHVCGSGGSFLLFTPPPRANYLIPALHYN